MLVHRIYKYIYIILSADNSIKIVFCSTKSIGSKLLHYVRDLVRFQKNQKKEAVGGNL